VEELLEGGLGVVPLAPLAALDLADLYDIVRQLDERVERDTNETTAGELRAALLLLLNLRYDADEVRAMIRGLDSLRGTPVYEVIFEDGQLAEARQNLLDLGVAKLGPASADVVRVLGQIDDHDMLRSLLLGVLTASTWDELLQDQRIA
jgi:hypothetical protein